MEYLVDPNPAESDPAESDPAWRDLRERWLPSAEQTAAAVAVLATVPEGMAGEWYAVVALAHPGKQYGLWQPGQRVAVVPGVWLGNNAPSQSEPDAADPDAADGPGRGAALFSLSEAVVAAEQAAASWMAAHGEAGTVSYALVSADGNAAVFESFASLSG